MESENITKQNCFMLTWESFSDKSTLMADGFFTMRGWQQEAFNQLKDEPFMILNAPMGSGKSWLMCLLSAFKMTNDNNLKCIIAVPQTIIAPGFADAKLQMPNGEKIYWHTNHNLCKNKPNGGTVNYIIKWLQMPQSNIADRVVLCTHATIVALHRKLKLNNDLYLLNNLLFWMDEAHHVKNTSVVDIEPEGFVRPPLLADKHSRQVKSAEYVSPPRCPRNHK